MIAAASLLAFAALAPTAALPRTVAESAEGIAQCERAVKQALSPATRAAPEVRFATVPSAPRALSDDGQTVLQGEGQWRDAGALRKFTYVCNLDPNSPEAVGVVIRHAATPTAAAAPQPFVEPDLTHLSPSACESSAAAALKQRWPRVSRITFDTTTRSLTQQSASHAELRGQGRAQPAPESQTLVHFGFDCAVDPRNGQVIGMRLSG